MSKRERLKSSFNFIRYFFPVVLIFSHLKYNLVALLYWVLLFAIVTDHIGRHYGIPFLFLSAEYQGNVGSWSFILLGFSFGGLTMAFNSYSYVRLGPRFPFLATVHKPFVKFCMNNAVIPVIFNIVYLMEMVRFQKVEEFASNAHAAGYVIAYLFGFCLFIAISIAYFFPTNKNFFDLRMRSESVPGTQPRWSRLSQGKTVRYDADARHPLYWYLGRSFRVQQCRSTRHYSATLLQNVFAQNRISTTVFEVTTVVAFVVLGLLGGGSVLDVPAAMSMVLLLTIVLMLFSAMISWLKGWTYIILITVLVGMDFFSGNWDVFQFENQAYGLSYDADLRVPYNNGAIIANCTDQQTITEDSMNYIALLNNWKTQTGEEKPMMILVNTSGGGSRSASWSFEVMRYIDSVSNGRFTRNTAIITGASGGMVGASFYRALLLKKKNGENVNLHDPVYYEQITEDLLNKLCFAASTNDIFFRYQSRLEQGTPYNYDRGMAFEGDLNENTHNVLNHKLSYFRRAEKLGRIPVMIYSPTIVNDGRRLLISSQELNFMTGSKPVLNGMSSSFENVDIHQLLKGNSVNDLRYTTILRMNATFPFVLPMVTLPTTPSIQIMDAGTRDNFGVKTMEQWMYAMRDWIKENTSGVLIVQIRDTKKMLTGQEIQQVTFLDKFTLPFSNVYGNFPRTQDFDQEELLKMSTVSQIVPMRFVSVNLREFAKNRISLSWHLTSKEKVKIKQAIWSEGNQSAVKVILQQLENPYITPKRSPAEGG